MTIKTGTKHWDGTRALDYCYNDGGRTATGRTGNTGDCVCRAVAIVTGKPYAEIYRALAAGEYGERMA